MALVSELVTQVKADTQHFNRNLDIAKNKALDFSNSAKVMQTAFVGAFAAIAASATLVYKILSDAIQRVDDLGKASQKAGIDFAAFQSLKYAADLSDVSIEKLQSSLGKMSSFVSKSNDGLKSNVDVLNKLGLSAKDLINLSVDQQFAKITTALQKMQNVTEQRAAIKDIFGRGGLEMMPLLQSNIEETRKEWESYGLTLTDAQFRQSELFNDLKTKISDVKDAFIQNIGANVAPAFSVLTQNILDSIKNMGGLRDVTQSVSAFIVNSMNGVIKVFNLLKDTISQLIEVLNNLSKFNPQNMADFGMGIVEDVQGSLLRAGLQTAIKNKLQSQKDTNSFTNNFLSQLNSTDSVKSAVNQLKGISPESATTLKLSEISKNLASGMSAASSASRKASEQLDDLTTSTEKASGAIQQLDQLLNPGSEKLGLDYISKNLPKGKEQLVDPAFNELLGSIRDQFSATGGKVNNQILQDLALAKKMANTADTTEWTIDTNKNLQFKEFSNSGMQNAVKLLEDFIKGKVNNKQEVKITVEPTNDFIVKVSNNSFTNKRMNDAVSNALSNAAFGANK